METGLIEAIGWVGSVLLAFCGLPQAIESFRTKSSPGVTWGLLIMWGAGEVLTLAYVFPKMELPLMFNYAANIVFLSVIGYYKVWPRRV
jgi:hypothetical protein